MESDGNDGASGSADSVVGLTKTTAKAATAISLAILKSSLLITVLPSDNSCQHYVFELWIIGHKVIYFLSIYLIYCLKAGNRPV